MKILFIKALLRTAHRLSQGKKGNYDLVELLPDLYSRG